jgi:hypothetical protein
LLAAKALATIKYRNDAPAGAATSLIQTTAEISLVFRDIRLAACSNITAHQASPDIAPAGLAPRLMWLKSAIKMQNCREDPEGHFVPGPHPVTALACSGTPGLAMYRDIRVWRKTGCRELPLHSCRSQGYDYPSRAATSRTCPAPASVMLVQYPG